MTACALALVACAHPDAPVVAQALCVDAAPKAYFPEGVFSPRAQSDRFASGWYSKHLAAMGELSLNCPTRFPVYRFLWLRTFHHPIAIRVEYRAGETVVFATELDGAGGYEPGKLLRRVERRLSKKEVSTITARLAAETVWAPPDEDHSFGADGAQWIVEARDGSRYRLHEMWSPTDGRVHRMGLAFLALTGWNIPAKQMY